MRYHRLNKKFLAAVLMASLLAIPSTVLAGIASDAWRGSYVARAESSAIVADVATSRDVKSAFERRIARPARSVTSEAVAEAPASVFTSGAFAGGCGARRVALAERPWCEEPKAGN